MVTGGCDANAVGSGQLVVDWWPLGPDGAGWVQPTDGRVDGGGVDARADDRRWLSSSASSSPPGPTEVRPQRYPYIWTMGKHLVDIDEAALAAAQAELKTTTAEETVNGALRLVCMQRSDRVTASLDRLARRDLLARPDAWR